jgi:hypothetical protein
VPDAATLAHHNPHRTAGSEPVSLLRFAEDSGLVIFAALRLGYNLRVRLRKTRVLVREIKVHYDAKSAAAATARCKNLSPAAVHVLASGGQFSR